MIIPSYVTDPVTNPDQELDPGINFDTVESDDSDAYLKSDEDLEEIDKSYKQNSRVNFNQQGQLKINGYVPSRTSVKNLDEDDCYRVFELLGRNPPDDKGNIFYFCTALILATAA